MNNLSQGVEEIEDAFGDFAYPFANKFNIPIKNTRKEEITFEVEFSEDDLFGKKQFVVPPETNAEYQIVFAPLTQFDILITLYPIFPCTVKADEVTF